MRNYIEIDKELIPYNFDIVLAGEEFNLAVMHNKTADLFTLTLSKNKKVLVHNEPVIYGRELFADVYQSGLYPMISIVPLDEAGNETAVTYDNLGKTVFLTINDQPESEAAKNE